MSDLTPPGGDDADDRASMRPKPGHGKDGRPFKDGNVRADGSYKVGKGRTAEDTRFKKGDGRPRGKRKKGSKNVGTIWESKLKQKITVNGVTQTGIEWVVEATIRRAITKSDRAAETAIEAAERFERARDPKLGLTDNQIMNGWFAQRGLVIPNSISEDEPPPPDGASEDLDVSDAGGNDDDR